MDDAPAAPSALFDLSGQVALVTGSSRGLGWAIAKALAAAGAHVVLNGRDAGTLRACVDRLRAWGLRGEAATFCVTDAASVEAAVADIGRRHGRLDILVSNAGGTVRKPLLEQTEADWHAVLDAHLTAAWRLSREAARLMVPAGYGRIVLIGSINGAVVRPGITGYVAAKTGLEGLARALAAELAPSGIAVNVLAPGYVPTAGNAGLRESDPDFARRIAARTPMGRWGKAEEIGAAALYLASRAAGFTTGSVLTVDGALTAVI
jgi:gluconate 5-dehydrogenase